MFLRNKNCFRTSTMRHQQAPQKWRSFHLHAKRRKNLKVPCKQAMKWKERLCVGIWSRNWWAWTSSLSSQAVCKKTFSAGRERIIGCPFLGKIGWRFNGIEALSCPGYAQGCWIRWLRMQFSKTSGFTRLLRSFWKHRSEVGMSEYGFQKNFASKIANASKTEEEKEGNRYEN